MRGGETTVTRYERWRHPNETRPACRWDIADPDAHLDHIVVFKRPDPGLWDRVTFQTKPFLFLLFNRHMMCIPIWRGPTGIGIGISLALLVTHSYFYHAINPFLEAT